LDTEGLYAGKQFLPALEISYFLRKNCDAAASVNRAGQQQQHIAKEAVMKFMAQT